MNDERYRTAHHDLRIWSDKSGTDWDVWLEPNDGYHDGVCLGGGESRDAAVQVAVDALESALRKLQETTGPERAAKLDKLRAAGKLGDEELRQWLLKRIEEYPNVALGFHALEIKVSRTGLESYLNGTYFAPRELGGGDRDPATSMLEKKIRAYRQRIEQQAAGSATA